MRDDVKKIFLTSIAMFSIPVFAQENNNSDIVNTEKVEKQENSQNNQEVVYDLNFDKNLLNKKEQKCFVPFSSWSKSVNLYNSCDIKVRERTLMVPLMSLQYRIRVAFDEKRPVFYDRIKMELNINCSEVVQNIDFTNWQYFNRDELNWRRTKLDNVNWFLTDSSEKLAKELCEAKLPKVYEKAIFTQKQRQEKWRLAKEREEKRKAEIAKKRIKKKNN